MKLGIFMMPIHPPERTPYDAAEWDLEMIRYADEIGWSEAWIGEHFTSEWEPVPAPDLLLAQAIKQTKQIKLAAGAHVLPYHHPAELAHRVAFLDHLSQGRILFGIGSGGLPSDYTLFNVDGANGENRKMTQEALEIILKLWTEKEPFDYRGNYWHVTKEEKGSLTGPFLYPYQQPHPPIAIGGLTRNSGTLKIAGKMGMLPMSFGLNNETILSHWSAYVEGAESTGKTPNRDEWRVNKDIFVADTDEEAYEWSLGSAMGRAYKEYTLPLFDSFGMISNFKHRSDVLDEEVNIEYLARNAWIVGSPDTVAKKLDAVYEQLGGFGTLLVTGFDYSEHPDVWKKSMRLLKEEVVPRMKHNRQKVY